MRNWVVSFARADDAQNVVYYRSDESAGAYETMYGSARGLTSAHRHMARCVPRSGMLAHTLASPQEFTK
jgi:hypothetical protein